MPEIVAAVIASVGLPSASLAFAAKEVCVVAFDTVNPAPVSKPK